MVGTNDCLCREMDQLYIHEGKSALNTIIKHNQGVIMQLQQAVDKLEKKQSELEEENIALKAMLCDITGKSSVVPSFETLRNNFTTLSNKYQQEKDPVKRGKLELLLENALHEYSRHPRKVKEDREEKKRQQNEWDRKYTPRLEEEYNSLKACFDKQTLSNKQRRYMKNFCKLFSPGTLKICTCKVDLQRVINSATDLRSKCAVYKIVKELNFDGTPQAAEKAGLVQGLFEELCVWLEKDANGILPKHQKLAAVWQDPTQHPTQHPKQDHKSFSAVAPRPQLFGGGKTNLAAMLAQQKTQLHRTRK